MNPPTSRELHSLEGQVDALARGTSAAEIFTRLIDSISRWVPRCAVFLLRENRASGWDARGYDDEAVERLRGWTDELAGWLGRAAESSDLTPVPQRPHESAPHFGQATAAQRVAVPVTVGGRRIGLVTAERGQDEQPWSVPHVCVLCRVAGLSLELLLNRRRPEASATEDRQAAEESPAAAPEPGPAAVTVPAIESHPEAAVELHPESDRLLEDDRHRQARSFARLVATDIRLYNEEAVVLGRRHGDLSRRLDAELNQGRQTFLRRFGDLGPDALPLLREAYVQVLGAGDQELFGDLSESAS